MDETAVVGRYCEKNFRKKKQKSKPGPGGCWGILQTSGKRKNHPITRRMIAMIIAGIPIQAASVPRE
jgi:hypothetical protein